MHTIFIFCAVQLINVIVSTIKYIATIKSSPLIAALINAISYTVSAIITYLISKQAVLIVIIITFCSNFIGVPLGRLIIDKLQKDQLWIYNITINCQTLQAEKIKHDFKVQNIDSIYEEIISNSRYSFRVFSHNKNESKYIKEKIKENNGRYYIVEAV